jgi:hypothetical protein
MKCSRYANLNTAPVNKALAEQSTSEPKVGACVAMYGLLQVVKCKSAQICR